MEITIGILSGGKSRRMGCDKAFLMLDGMTFLDHIIQEMAEYPELILSVASADKYKKYKKICVTDHYQNIGPIEGIRRILTVSSHEMVFICAVDMPFINRVAVTALVPLITQEYDCCILKGKDGIHPLCGIYTKRMLRVIENMIDSGQYQLYQLLKQCRTRYVPIEETDLFADILENVNHKEDYQRILK